MPRSWNPVMVRAVGFDQQHRLWFASEQGVGVYDFEASRWRLFDPRDGLPWNGFTTLHPGDDNDVWLGTDRGLIRLAARHRRHTTHLGDAARTTLPARRPRTQPGGGRRRHSSGWRPTAALAALEWLDTSLSRQSHLLRSRDRAPSPAHPVRLRRRRLSPEPGRHQPSRTALERQRRPVDQHVRRCPVLRLGVK